MVQAINPDRIVPVQEDLATPADQFQVIRGFENMIRRDYPLADGVSALPGEFLVLGNNGKLTRPTTTAVINSFVVMSGTDRFDVSATKAATVIMSDGVVIRTKRYAAGSYNVGDMLTAKDLGGGEAHVSAGATSEPHVAMVTAVGSDYIEYQLLHGRADTTA